MYPYSASNQHLSRLWFPSNHVANANLLLLESAILQTLTSPGQPIYLDQTGFGFTVAAPGTTGPGKLWMTTGQPTNLTLPASVDGDWAVDISANPRALYGARAGGNWPSPPITAASLSVATVWYGWGLPSNTLGQNNDVFLDQMTGVWYGPRQPLGWPVTGFNPQAGASFATVGQPSNATGQNGQWAIDTAAGLIYFKTSGVWGPGSALAPVPVGTWTVTSGVPVGGNPGDFAIDPATLDIYGPYNATTGWPAPMSFAPRPGVWFPTTGTPAGTVGIPGDFAFDKAALVVYGPAGGVAGATVWPAGTPLGQPIAGGAVPIVTTSGQPAPGVGAPGMTAYDPATGLYYLNTAGTWGLAPVTTPVVFGLLQGTTGQPANTLGNNGDWAYDEDANVIWGMKSGGTWPTPGRPVYAVPQTQRPVITGSVTTNTAAVLAQLLTGLAANGQIINNTTP